MTWAHPRHLDAPDALHYLEEVKSHLTGDTPSFNTVIRQVEALIGDTSSDPAFVNSVVTVAKILRTKPRLFHGLNSILRRSNRIECSTQVDEVDLFVIVTPTMARICSASSAQINEPTTAEELLALLSLESGWQDLLKKDPCKAWLTCISQLLQVILDDPKTAIPCRRKAYRCLRELALTSSILPPSLFLNNIARVNGFPVQGGAFADIYSGVIKETPICFRVLRMFNLPQAERDELYKDFCQEVLVWRQLKHPNVLPFLGANTTSFSPQFCFISYWMNNGDIMAYLKRNPDHDRFRAISEIVEGIEYLYSLDPPVTHKDIKGANVLVTDDLTCCLADFGLSSILESERLNGRSPAAGGSVCWLAPELMRESGPFSKKDAKAADIFSLGCTIFEIYTGKPPHSHLRVSASIMFAVCQGERPEVPPPGRTWTPEELEMWWLVEQCWKQKAIDRPEIHLIKAHLKEIAGRKQVQKDLRTPSPSISGVDPETAAADELEKVRDWLQRERVKSYAQESREIEPAEFSPHNENSQHDLNAIVMNAQRSRSKWPPPPTLNVTFTSVQHANGLITPTTPTPYEQRRLLPPVPISATSRHRTGGAVEPDTEAMNGSLSLAMQERLRSFTPGLPTPPMTPSPLPKADATKFAFLNDTGEDFDSPPPVATKSPHSSTTSRHHMPKPKPSARLSRKNAHYFRETRETRPLSPLSPFNLPVSSPLHQNNFLVLESDREDGTKDPPGSPTDQTFQYSYSLSQRDALYTSRSSRQTNARTAFKMQDGPMKQNPLRTSVLRSSVLSGRPHGSASRSGAPQPLDSENSSTVPQVHCI